MDSTDITSLGAAPDRQLAARRRGSRGGRRRGKTSRHRAMVEHILSDRYEAWAEGGRDEFTVVAQDGSAAYPKRGLYGHWAEIRKEEQA